MEEQIDKQEKTKTMKKKKKNTDRVEHRDLSKMEEQIEEEASFCSLLTVPRAGILWRFCEKNICNFLPFSGSHTLDTMSKHLEILFGTENCAKYFGGIISIPFNLHI